MICEETESREFTKEKYAVYRCGIRGYMKPDRKKNDKSRQTDQPKGRIFF